MLALENRPFKFADVIGNETTIKDFQKRAIDKKFPSVIFLTGTTGTGKTTLSYIISALINCENPIKENNFIEPCGICKSCIDIKTEKFGRDIVRINGGTVGKDDVTEIENRVLFSPMYDKNKIIIIEESHLLTGCAKEQTLLMLEKPYKNIYFILISTEIGKFPNTVLDRGQVYRFKPLSTEIIVKYIVKLLDKYDPSNKVPNEFVTEGIIIIAENSGGSLRKAISDFERCLNSEIYTNDLIEKELYFLSEKKLYELLNMLICKDKQFFEDISKVTIEDYFYYSWKVLTNSRVVEMTIKDINEASWQEKSSLKYCNNENFKGLVQAYQKIFADNNKPYFNANIFYNYVIDYYQIVNIPLIQKSAPTITNQPVRRIR